MKPTREERAELLQRIAAARSRQRLSYASIADLSGVDASQVSRICRGHFATFGDSVVRICTVLGVDMLKSSGAAAPALRRRKGDGQPDPGWTKLERSVRRIWDRSPEGAERLARVLSAVAQLRDG